MEQLKIFNGYTGEVEKEFNAWRREMRDKIEIVQKLLSGSHEARTVTLAIFYKYKT